MHMALHVVMLRRGQCLMDTHNTRPHYACSNRCAYYIEQYLSVRRQHAVIKEAQSRLCQAWT